MFIDNSVIEKILIDITKPGRYTGGEINSVKKEFPSVQAKFVLCYPDLYEIGMSNLGIKILYEILNNHKNMLAERVFSPWFDFEGSLKNNNIPLYSLESKASLTEFDFVGFSVSYELLYTNILNILQLGNIPLHSSERNETHPIILAGGTAVFNPEPLADFIDLFIIGDGESIILEIGEMFIALKEKGIGKKEILEKLSNLTGIYYPAKYNLKKNKSGMLIPEGKVVKKLVERNLNDKSYPLKPVVPNINIAHNRGIIEVSRGCLNGCRFCQAGIIYRPVRERNLSNILFLVESIIKSCGYFEFSLLSLSISDYSLIKDILLVLNKRFGNGGISFSLPSLRIDSFNFDLLEKIGEVRKSGLTFAVESGSEEIRIGINKGKMEQIYDILKEALKRGWKSIKFYFMIGLPSGTINEEEAIVDFIDSIRSLGRGININININTFNPKAHTPFQWIGQIETDKAKESMNFIINSLRSPKIKISYPTYEMSSLETVFARGDRRLCSVLEKAFESGARFDGWDEVYKNNLWENAFSDKGIDKNDYLRPFSVDDDLPWDHIDTGVKKEFLLEEYKNSLSGKITEDCYDHCSNMCGVCNEDVKNIYGDKDIPEDISPFFKRINLYQSPLSKIRIKFTKIGFIKYISHLDMVNIFSRAFIKSDLPVFFTKGFNPIPKMEFSQPLSLGMESISEYLDFKITENIAVQEILLMLNESLPEGITVLKVKEVPISSRGIDIVSDVLEYNIKVSFKDLSILNSSEIMDKVYSIDVLNSGEIVFRQKRKLKEAYKIQDIMNIISENIPEAIPDKIIRSNIYSDTNGGLVELIDLE